MRSRMLYSIGVFAALVSTTLAEKKPNIVYIMSDELAYFELSHMGNPYIKTPNIDRFAKEGIRFTSALAGAPVCAPLRCCVPDVVFCTFYLQRLVSQCILYYGIDAGLCGNGVLPGYCGFVWTMRRCVQNDLNNACALQ